MLLPRNKKLGVLLYGLIVIQLSSLTQCATLQFDSFTSICGDPIPSTECAVRDDVWEGVTELLTQLKTVHMERCAAKCGSKDNCKVFGFYGQTKTQGTCVLLPEYFNCTVLTSTDLQCYAFKAKVNTVLQRSML